MAAHVFRIYPSHGVWVIRHNTVHAAQCPDRDSALRLAHALARGQHARCGETVAVYLDELDRRASTPGEIEIRP